MLCALLAYRSNVKIPWQWLVERPVFIPNFAIPKASIGMSVLKIAEGPSWYGEICMGTCILPEAYRDLPVGVHARQGTQLDGDWDID